MSFIIKCKTPSGGYVGGKALSGNAEDWTVDDLAFVSDPKEAHAFATLDAALRAKKSLSHKNIDAEIVDLDKPKRGSTLKKTKYA